MSLLFRGMALKPRFLFSPTIEHKLKELYTEVHDDEHMFSGGLQLNFFEKSNLTLIISLSVLLIFFKLF